MENEATSAPEPVEDVYVVFKATGKHASLLRELLADRGHRALSVHFAPTEFERGHWVDKIVMVPVRGAQALSVTVED